MDPDYFYFKQFRLRNTSAALKVNTDGVLLGGWVDISKAKNILEVGTGSGVISLMMHQKNVDSLITAIDIDTHSCEEAQFNIDLNKWESSIKVFQSSIENFTPNQSFDHIVSNPPYFTNSTLPEKSNLQTSKHGFDVAAFWQSVQRLSHDNTLVSIIIPYESAELYNSRAHKVGFKATRILNIMPRPNTAFHRTLITYSRHGGSCDVNEMYMHDEGRNNYSEAYRALLKDFYLKF